MKVKFLTSYPKKTINVDNIYISSDLHINHEAVITYGRKFNNVDEMNDYIISHINSKVNENDMLILLGDTMMVNKDYQSFLDSLICKNIVLLNGNHCNPGKIMELPILYHGYYLELNIDKRIICMSHYPMFNWNYQDDGAFHLHGHLHGDESDIVKEIHKYKSMDVGIDAYYNLYGEYGIFSYEQIKELLKDKKVIGRHE